MKLLRYIILTAYLVASVFPKAQTVAPVDTSNNVIVCILDSGGVNTVEYAGDADYSDHGGHGTFNANLIQDHSGAEILSYCITPVVGGVQVGDAHYINLALKNVLERAQSDTAHRYVVLLNAYGEGIPDGMETLIEMRLLIWNVPVIVPAGNEGIETDNRYPSCFESPICIAADKLKRRLCGDSFPRGTTSWILLMLAFKYGERRSTERGRNGMELAWRRQSSRRSRKHYFGTPTNNRTATV